MMALISFPYKSSENHGFIQSDFFFGGGGGRGRDTFLGKTAQSFLNSSKIYTKRQEKLKSYNPPNQNWNLIYCKNLHKNPHLQGQGNWTEKHNSRPHLDAEKDPLWNRVCISYNHRGHIHVIVCKTRPLSHVAKCSSHVVENTYERSLPPP